MCRGSGEVDAQELRPQWFPSPLVYLKLSPVLGSHLTLILFPHAWRKEQHKHLTFLVHLKLTFGNFGPFLLLLGGENENQRGHQASPFSHITLVSMAKSSQGIE